VKILEKKRGTDGVEVHDRNLFDKFNKEE